MTAVAVTSSKPRAVSLVRGVRWDDAAAIVLGACRSHFEANLAGALRGRVEAVHQLRVAARRMRVALSFFGDALDARERAALALDLRWLGRKLGPLREAQVFIEDVWSRVRARSPRAVAVVAMTAVARDEVSGRLDVVRSALRGHRGQRALARLGRLSVVTQRPAFDAAEHARKRLSRLHDDVMALADAKAVADPKALHELRKRLKKLRYAAQFVGSLYDPEAVRRDGALLAKVQKAIGAMLDAKVSRALFRRLRAQAGAGAREPRIEDAVEALLRPTREQDVRTFARALRRYDAVGRFWR